MTTSIPRDTRELQSLALFYSVIRAVKQSNYSLPPNPPTSKKRKKKKQPSSYISKHQKYSPGKLEALSSSRLMHCLAGGVHKNELLAAFGVQLGRPSLRNELAFADRQSQNDGVTPKGSEGIFHCFSWRVRLAARHRSRRALRQRGPWHKAAIWAGDICWALCEYMPACLILLSSALNEYLTWFEKKKAARIIVSSPVNQDVMISTSCSTIIPQ